MRVAALYDVHGNLPALDAVLAEVAEERVDRVVVGGDIACGPLPRETVAVVRALDAVCIRGNGDLRTADAEEWFWSQLDDEDAAWLQGLPERAVLGDSLFCHATPRSDEEIVTPATTDGRLAEILAGVEQTVVVGGHTHMQQDRTVGGIRFVNPGSVGMPYEDGPGAYWALVGEQVELRRTDYDLAAAAEAIRLSGYPDADEFVRANVLAVPSREEAIAVFGG